MLHSLQVRLLGAFDLRQGSEVIQGLDQARLRELLAYLLLHRASPVSRQQLAFLFWPDSTENRPAPTYATSGTACGGPCRTRIGS